MVVEEARPLEERTYWVDVALVRTVSEGWEQSGVFWLAAEGRGKTEAAAMATEGRRGWWRRCKEVIGGLCGLVGSSSCCCGNK